MTMPGYATQSRYSARRPLALRCAPLRLRLSLWSRFYRGASEKWLDLYEQAPLHLAPGAKMRLIPRDFISDCIAFTGVYELRLSRWLARLARTDGGVMVDVGANLGYFSLLWAALRATNSVVAFEASPRNLDLLQDNVRRNGVENRIEVRREAVGREQGTRWFDLGPADQTGWGRISLRGTSDSVAVDVVTIDAALANVTDVALLKIDIEGADFWALEGAGQALREHRVRHIWWEENKPRMRELGIAPGDAAKFVGSFGYVAAPQNDPAADIVEWYARKP